MVSPYHAKIINLNIQPLEVMSRYHDLQPKVVEKYSYLFNLRENIYTFCHFIPNNSALIG